MGVIFSTLDMLAGAVVAPLVMPSLVLPCTPAPRPSFISNRRRSSTCSSSSSSSGNSTSSMDRCTHVKFVWFRVDGLDSVEVVPSTHDDEYHSQQRGSETTAGAIPLAERRYVVVMLGNAARMDNHLDTFSSIAFSTSASVIGFDSRGIGKSAGWPCGYKHLVDDYLKQVRRLLRRGVVPSQITLYGQSMGGAVAVCAARKLYALPRPVGNTNHSASGSAGGRRRLRETETGTTAGEMRSIDANARDRSGVKVFADRTFSSVRDLTPYFIHLFAFQLMMVKDVHVPLWARNTIAQAAAMVLPYAWRMAPKEDVLFIPIESLVVLNHREDSMIPLPYSLLSSLPKSLRRSCGFTATSDEGDNNNNNNNKPTPLPKDPFELITDFGFMAHEAAVITGNFMWDRSLGVSSRERFKRFVRA